MAQQNSGHLQISALSKAYGTQTVVRDVTLDVAQGELVVLLGPSGCGKTTTLRLIAGFVAASGGRIILDGRDCAGLPPHQRDMGMVFQSYALFPHLTVAQNVAFGLRMRRASKSEIAARVTETLQLVRLEGVSGRYPRQLSGGQQQRVALARALAIRPKLLLLDEPLSNLDANLRRTVAREIRQLQRSSGLTTLMVTHDQEEAMIMADRLVLMSDGVVQQQGTQETLYEEPANPFVARFIGESNLVLGELKDGTCLMTKRGDEIRLAARYQGAGRCTLAVRPERLRLAQDGEPVRATLRVEDRTYAGGHVEYLLALASGETVTLREPTTGSRDALGHASGATVDVTWDLASERLFDASDRPLPCGGPTESIRRATVPARHHPTEGDLT